MTPRFVRIATALFALAALLLLAGDLAVIALHYPRSPNDGWNAYNALHLLQQGRTALYPVRPSLLINNYPPLSFVVVAWMARFGGDTLLAGRILSLGSALLVALMVTVIARALKAGKRESLLAGLMFLLSPWVLSKFAGVSNPQLFGTALDCFGLLLLLHAPPTYRAVIAAALFFTLALFVKLVFVAMPLAALAWLVLYHRRHAILFVVAGLGFAAVGLVASNLIFQTDIFAQVLSARVFVPGQMLASPGMWLITGALPLAASLWLFRLRDDPAARFCAIYAATAFPLAVFFCGGEGVSGDPTIDLSIAVALGSALFLTRAAPLLAANARLRTAVITATVLIALAGVIAFVGGLSSGPASFEQIAHRAEAERDIQFLARQQGPALCEMLSLCYWAGKQDAVDTFGLGEAFKRHVRPESDLGALLDAHAFSVLQFTRHSNFAYSPYLQAAIARNYRLDHADDLGHFFVPR